MKVLYNIYLETDKGRQLYKSELTKDELCDEDLKSINCVILPVFKPDPIEERIRTEEYNA